MNEEELLLRFHADYPGVYLAVTHQCRIFRDQPVHEWTFWDADAGEHVGPCHTSATLLAAIQKWERSGERDAACEMKTLEETKKARREQLARERLAEDREALEQLAYGRHTGQVVGKDEFESDVDPLADTVDLTEAAMDALSDCRPPEDGYPDGF